MSHISPSRMNRDEFVTAFSGVFEHSPWVAENAFACGVGDQENAAEGLHGLLCRAMRAADPARKLELIHAHPDLAGKLVVQGKLTAASSAEQQSAGLDKCSPEEFERLTALNGAYAARFGFPFIMAVKGSKRSDIIAAMEARIGNDPEAEFEMALQQIEKIAYLRLEELFG